MANLIFLTLVALMIFTQVITYNSSLVGGKRSESIQRSGSDQPYSDRFVAITILTCI